ncbi:MAG: EamA family transporter [Hyphomicrobiaceae bacterium]
MNARGPHLGLLALLATALLWGSNHVVARAVSETVPLPSLVFWRWFVAATLLTPLAMPGIRRSVPFLRANLVEIIVNATLGVGVFSYLLLGAAYNSLALEVGIINATTPLCARRRSR